MNLSNNKERNKIEVLLMGKLGNQLFQYAFAISRAEELQSNYEIILTNSEQNVAKKYFELPSDTTASWKYSFSFLRERTKKKLLGSAKYNTTLNAVEFNNEQSPEEVLKLAATNGRYKGFFQSDRFFKKNASLIKKQLEIKESYQKIFSEKYEELFANNKVVVIHIRAKDYLTHGNEALGGKSLVLPKSYYENCLEKINTKDAKVLFVSDDIPYCKQIYGMKDNYIYSTENMMTDFQLIQHADVKIISNSTFSWWAAYLNKKPNAITYAPKNWFGFRVNREVPKGIMTDLFQWVDVL